MSNMIKKSAAEIQQWLHEHIHKLEGVAKSNSRIEVPEPSWHDPDPQQRNWNIQSFPNSQGHEDDLFRMVQDARSRFWLEKME